MVFHALTFARSPGRCWKPRPNAAVFNTSQGTWRMLMHWKTMFECYYCIKTENICYISRYFLHYFVSPFHRCLANAITTDYARFRAWQYTSRNGNNSVAPVRAYWKLRSRALAAQTVPQDQISEKNSAFWNDLAVYYFNPDMSTVIVFLHFKLLICR